MRTRNVIPSKLITLDIDKKDVTERGLIPKGMDSLAVDQMQFELLHRSAGEKDLALLDLIATNNWERPIYFFNNTVTSPPNQPRHEDYAIQECETHTGFLPIRNANLSKEFVNTEVSHDNMINKFHYRGLNQPVTAFLSPEDYRGFALTTEAR